MRRLVFAVSLIFSLLVPLSSWAAFSNYNSILIGDQAAGMGSACVAMGEDPAAMPFYNPAGLVWLEGEAFSSAVGIYKKFDSIFGTGDDLAQRGLKVNQGFFRAIPSSTASIIRTPELLKGYTFGLSIVVPEYDYYQGDINSTTDNVSTLNLVDESLWVGGSIARKISINEAMGISIYYTARALTKTVSDRTLTGSNKTVFTEERNIKNNNIVAIFGYQYKWTPDFIFGFSWRLPSLNISGRANYFDSLYQTGSTSISSNVFVDQDSQFKIPEKYIMGMAYRPIPKLWLTADLSVYRSLIYRDMEVPEIAEKIEHRAIWNGALGAEYALYNWFKVRLGAYTNLSSHPDPDPLQVRGQADKVDQLGFSANVALRRKQIEYTFGGYYTGGRGRSVQRFEQQLQNIDKSTQVFTMLVGTSYYF